MAEVAQALPGQDCYFFVYSSCSRGEACPFRHEPAALTNETVCNYWKAGACTKPHCIFRHLEDKRGKKRPARNVTPCYWEGQPQGCAKPHCPFLHQFPKDPVSQPLPVRLSTGSRSPSPVHNKAVAAAQLQRLDSGSIIVNPAKLSRLQGILPANAEESLGAGGARRMVVPAGVGHLARRAVTGGIKSRLGGDTRVRERLGGAGGEGWDAEADRLRKAAAKKLDLRGRLETSPRRRVVEEEVDSAEEELEMMKKQRKLAKKEKKLKEETKLEKILRKEERVRRKLERREREERRERGKVQSRLGSVVAAVQVEPRIIRRVSARSPLPSASDYSDLESPDREMGSKVMSVVKTVDRDRQAMEAAREERRLRMSRGRRRRMGRSQK